MPKLTFLHKLKISQRILAVTLLGATLFLVLAGAYFAERAISSTYENQQAHFAEVDNLVKATRAATLGMQSTEKSYLLNSTPVSKNIVLELEDTISANLETLISKVDDAEFNVAASELGERLVEHHELFLAISENLETVGLTEDVGLRGALRSAVHEAETAVDTAKLDALTVKILMMRRHEKDFIIRGGEKYIGRIDERVAEFKTLLDASPLSGGDKTNIWKLIQSYQSSFKTFSDKKLELAGQIEQLNSFTSKTVPLLAKMSAYAEAQAASANAQIGEVENAVSIAMTALIVVGLVILGLLGWIIGNSISRPLNRLAEVADELGQDNLHVEIKNDENKTEIGTLTRSLIIFKENAIKVAELGEEEAARQKQLATRAKMMEKLQASFGEVVGAAAAGDFSKRVDENVPDEELANLSRSVNHLVETVDDGLKKTGEVLAALANTDLTKRVEGQYQGAFAQLQNDTNRVADRLTDVVKQLRETSRSLKSATGEILAGANDLSERTTRQAATIEETSAAMEQLAETVLENAKEAEEASSNADRVKSTAEQGGEVMRQANNAMERITESSAKISNIIGMIDDIAFQTNLLALNASVEAARAGEAGKGFAVVAVEVRRLAQSAAEASSDVKALIEQSGAEVKDGTELVGKAAGSLESMLDAARSNNESMVAIAAKSRSQATSIEEINTAVRDMDEATQHNAALVEETNAAIEQTEGQANELDRIVDIFVTEDGGTPRLPIGANNEVPEELPVQTGIKALREKAMDVAKTYLTNGNAAVKQQPSADIDEEWQEF